MSIEEKKKTILLVDDDVDFQEQIKIQLNTAGYEVITAEGQKEAEQKLETFRPDLVISDLMMENYDGGFGLSEHVKKMDPTIPVILVTSVTNELGFKFTTNTEDERSWIKADAILNKPIRFEQLMKEMGKLLK